MGQHALNPDTCVSAQAASEVIPADQLLCHAIAALSVLDVSGLRALEGLAAQAAVPLDWARYRKLCAVYATLLAATARNLRMARRISTRTDEANPYRVVDSMAAARN